MVKQKNLQESIEDALAAATYLKTALNNIQPVSNIFGICSKLFVCLYADLHDIQQFWIKSFTHAILSFSTFQQNGASVYLYLVKGPRDKIGLTS